jgi:hypothetical protein
MEAVHTNDDSGGIESAPHFVDEPKPAQAWEEIEVGRFMPRRIRGSYQGRALG